MLQFNVKTTCIYKQLLKSPYSISLSNVNPICILSFKTKHSYYYSYYSLKKYLTKLDLILKLCSILLTKNNICLFDSKMQTLNVIHSVELSLVESAVFVSCCLAGEPVTLAGLQWLLKKILTLTFNNTELDTQRCYKKINYNYVTRFIFWLPLNPVETHRHSL